MLTIVWYLYMCGTSVTFSPPLPTRFLVLLSYEREVYSLCAHTHTTLPQVEASERRPCNSRQAAVVQHTIVAGADQGVEENPAQVGPSGD